MEPKKLELGLLITFANTHDSFFNTYVMKRFKKYFWLFLLEFILFSGVLCLFDWNKMDTKLFYSNIIQGFFFGLFMSFYSYWSDKKKAKKKLQELNEQSKEPEKE